MTGEQTAAGSGEVTTSAPDFPMPPEAPQPKNVELHGDPETARRDKIRAFLGSLTWLERKVFERRLDGIEPGVIAGELGVPVAKVERAEMRANEKAAAWNAVEEER